MKNSNFSASELPPKYNFCGIDLLKFVCAIFVFIIHVAPFSWDWYAGSLRWNDIVQDYMCRIAVPFYFIAAGFFLFRKIDLQNPDVNILKEYCFKILRFWATWTLIFSSTNNYQMWYMTALVVAVILLGILVNCKVQLRYIGCIVILLYVIGLLGDSYYGLSTLLRSNSICELIITSYEAHYSTTRNGLFMGLPFLFIGALFAQKKIVMNMKLAVVGFAASMALMFAEMIVVRNWCCPKDLNMYIFLVPASFFLFYIATHVQLKERAIYGRLRVIGMLIFYMHLFVKETVESILGYLPQSLLFLIMLASVLALAMLIEWLSRKEKLKWLRWLYT